MSHLLYTLPRSCQTPASTIWSVRCAGTETPRRAQNVHAHARARTACVTDAPGHVVVPPAPSPPPFSFCARRTTATPATPWTRPPGRGNPVHHAMADAIRHSCQDARTMTSATVHCFHRRQALRHRQDLACTPASSPVHHRRCSTVAMGDIVTAPRAPPAAIKGAIPAPKSSHHRAPLSLLTHLDHFPSPISL